MQERDLGEDSDGAERVTEGQFTMLQQEMALMLCNAMISLGKILAC